MISLDLNMRTKYNPYFEWLQKRYTIGGTRIFFILKTIFYFVYVTIGSFSEKLKL